MTVWAQISYCNRMDPTVACPKKTQSWQVDDKLKFLLQEIGPPNSLDLNPLNLNYRAYDAHKACQWPHPNIASLLLGIWAARSSMTSEYIKAESIRFQSHLDEVVVKNGGILKLNK